MTKPLLIGQAPGPNTRPDKPLFPYPTRSAGARLQRMTGLSRTAYLRTFDRTNLLQQFPGSIQNGDAFPMSKARPAAQAVEQLLGGREVILVGRLVATAFGLRELPFFEWHANPVWDYRVVVIPHPSGRNHWYNDEANRETARAWWRNYVARVQRTDKGRGPWWPPNVHVVDDGVHRSTPRGTCRSSRGETPSPSCEASR